MSHVTNKFSLAAYLSALMLFASACSAAAASENYSDGPVSDAVIEAQRAALAAETEGSGYGPQSPRDIDDVAGSNGRIFSEAPPSTSMNLCNIHFHKNAEHRGGEFTTYAGNGDGEGFGTGYKYDGKLSARELRPLSGGPIADEGDGGLVPGDTIEVHYVYTTAEVEPGPTLDACLSDSIINPQLRVETQVLVLVNKKQAADFIELAEFEFIDGYYQAINIPTDSGTPVQYEGSTTGPSFNEVGSPIAVSWSVRPQVIKVDIQTVGAWLADNIFEEDHAHGVRNLVINPDLLSEID